MGHDKNKKQGVREKKNMLEKQKWGSDSKVKTLSQNKMKTGQNRQANDIDVKNLRLDIAYYYTWL